MAKQFLWNAQPLGPAQQAELQDQSKYLGNVERAIAQEQRRLQLQVAQGQAGNQALQAQQKYLAQLDKTVEREKQKLKLKTDLVKAGVGVVTGEQQYQKELDKTIQKMETQARLKKDLIKLGYLEGKPSGGGPWAALKSGASNMLGGSAGATNLAIWAKIGDTIGQRIQAHIPGQTLAEYNLRPGEAGSHRGARERRQFEAGTGDIRSAITLGGPTDYVMPSLGRTYDQVADAYRMNQPFTIRAQETESMRANLELQRQRQSALAGGDRRRMELLRQQGHQGALARFGMSSAAPQAQAYLGGQAALMPFQAGGAGRAGYARGEAMQDFAGAVGHAVRKAQQETEQRRQASVLGAEQRVAGGQAAQRYGEVMDARKQLAAAERQRGVTSPYAEVNDQRRLAVEQAYIALKEREKLFDEARGQAQQLEMQRSEMLNQHGQQRLGLLQQEHSRLQGIVRAEKEREISRQSAFGLAHPMQQRTALGIAMKMRQGRQLTQQEIEFTGSMPEWFGHRLQQTGLQRAGQFGFEAQMRQLLPEVGERRRQAEQQLRGINQQIQVAIQFDPQKTAEQITGKVLPAISQALAEVEARIKEDLNRLQNQRWLNRGALTGH